MEERSKSKRKRKDMLLALWQVMMILRSAPKRCSKAAAEE
jgi:hypothetical protein